MTKICFRTFSHNIFKRVSESELRESVEYTKLHGGNGESIGNTMSMDYVSQIHAHHSRRVAFFRAGLSVQLVWMGTGYAATKWNPTRNRKGLANNFRRSKPTIHTDDQSPIKENLPPRTSPSRACSPSPFITRSPSDSSRKHTNHHFTKSSITSSDQVLIQKLRADSFQRQLHNERKKVTRARDTQMQLKGRINDLEDNLKGATSSSSKLLDVMGRELDAAKQALEKTTTDLHQSKLRSASLAHDKDILKKRVKRIPDRVETAVKRAVASFSTQSLKDKGIITDRVRECVRELISDNVPMEKVSSIIHTVATTFGVTLDDDLTSRSVGRIVREGGIIARCQIVDIVKQSEGTFIDFLYLFLI